MKKLLLSVTFTLALIAGAFAQNDLDAFRFSQTSWEGTARFMGAGGAFSAIGGDFSCLSTNPAGLGVFKKSEISFTPLVITAYKTNSDYSGETSPATRVRYSLTNFGTVFALPLHKGDDNPVSKWRMMQFAFGYNRIMDFNNQTYAAGNNNGNSIATAFVNAANGTGYGSIEGDALCAWETWLIDTIPGETSQYREFLSGHSLRQSNYVKTSGGIDEMDFSFGGNYDDKLFLGLTVGVPIIRYHYEAKYMEEDEHDVVPSFDNLTISDDMETSGAGVNAKLGVIYQPVPFLRIGAAFHTPTYYPNLTEKYNRYVESEFSENDETKPYDYSYDNISKYKLGTPLRAIGSIGFLIAKRAFISAEYEFTDYGMATLYSSDNFHYMYNFTEENLEISKKYRACHSVRVGGELTLSNFFLIRLGYGYSTSPFKEGANDGSAHTASGGIGFRGKIFFCDFTYQFRHYGQNYWFYPSETLDPVSTTNNSHRFIATLGVKF